MDKITEFVGRHIASNWLRSGVLLFLLLLAWDLFEAAVEPHGKYGVVLFGWGSQVLQWSAVICLGAYAVQLVTGRRSSS